MFTWTSLRVTRSMKRRRNESFQPGPASRSQKLFSPLCAPPLRRDVPRASFQLTDLPSEIGILIADRLDTASRASMVLVNRTTASWVSKSLLARVNAGEDRFVALNGMRLGKKSKAAEKAAFKRALGQMSMWVRVQLRFAPTRARQRPVVAVHVRAA